MSICGGIYLRRSLGELLNEDSFGVFGSTENIGCHRGRRNAAAISGVSAMRSTIGGVQPTSSQNCSNRFLIFLRSDCPMDHDRQIDR
jgi:hypothetical protein